MSRRSFGLDNHEGCSFCNRSTDAVYHSFNLVSHNIGPSAMEGLVSFA